MKFINLRNISGATIPVNVNHIVAIYSHNDEEDETKSIIHLGDKHRFHCNESKEDIINRLTKAGASFI